MDPSTALIPRNIYIIIEKFIVAPGATLNGFSRKTLEEFLVYDCGVLEELYRGGGSMCDTLRYVLQQAEVPLQRRILESLVERFPPRDYAFNDTPERERFGVRSNVWLNA